MAENRKEVRQREKLGDVILMVTSGERCFRFKKDDVTEITELRSTQEEADTRMMIHVKHAATSNQNVVVNSEDTDVFVIGHGHNHRRPSPGVPQIYWDMPARTV